MAKSFSDGNLPAGRLQNLCELNHRKRKRMAICSYTFHLFTVEFKRWLEVHQANNKL